MRRRDGREPWEGFRKILGGPEVSEEALDEALYRGTQAYAVVTYAAHLLRLPAVTEVMVEKGPDAVKLDVWHYQQVLNHLIRESLDHMERLVRLLGLPKVEDGQGEMREAVDRLLEQIGIDRAGEGPEEGGEAC